MQPAVPQLPPELLDPPRGPVLDWVRAVIKAAEWVVEAMAKWIDVAAETRHLAADARVTLARLREQADKLPDYSHLDARWFAAGIVVAVVGWGFASGLARVVGPKLVERWFPPKA